MKYENGIETKNIILENSYKLFFSKGYNETSIREISRKSNISSGTLYKHFENKADILHQLVEPHINKIIDLWYKEFERFNKLIKNSDSFSNLIIEFNDNSGAKKIFDIFQKESTILNFILFNSKGTEYENFFDEIIELEFKNTMKSLNIVFKNKEYLNFASELEFYYVIESSIRMTLNTFKSNLSLEEKKHYLSIIYDIYTPFWQKIFSGEF